MIHAVPSEPLAVAADILDDDPASIDPDTLEEMFWSSRPELERIRGFAHARMAAPWAVLGCILARAAASIEPHVMLPAIVGTTASTNLFLALVGPSGGGKGAAEGAARDAVQFLDPWGNPIDVDEFTIGSGEGIARTYRAPATDEDDTDEQGRTRALFTAPEVDTLAALGSRQGSTLLGELRKAWSGESLGFQNGQKHTRHVLPRHSYRLCLIVGVQPAKAGPIIGDADGGTPQRFVWLHVQDSRIPRRAPDAAIPGPLTVSLPRFSANDEHLVVPDEAREEITTHRHAVVTGKADANPLDGHALLTRLKVAAAFMVLAGRSVVSAEDWHLAAILMHVSRRTRADVERELSEKSRAANRARAHLEAERNEIVEDKRHEANLNRAVGGIRRYLARHGASPRHKVRTSLKKDVRDQFDDALWHLIDGGEVRRIDRGGTDEYALSD
ncbi:hypothetical protein HT102_03365 [Hoyosella sp. G463]|uniref:DUF3987 domain-containing protein n=1 Tax=Lolliginicoccus lacisalsi TaxID=2742202 RepID=A0A927JAX0_9ACTN|nr:hypothetical protein [Lolliginicoccus lacisalsi]MBD8505530.1 hypothetical protein [Lolliginicoccus lacisalsi]